MFTFFAFIHSENVYNEIKYNLKIDLGINIDYNTINFMKRRDYIMKLLKKIMGLGCVALGVAALASCDGDKDKNETYTYHTTMAIEPKTFNPHTWETNDDSLVSSYAEIGFLEPIYDVAKNDGSYTWAYEMATGISDYTQLATAAEKEKWGVKPDEKERLYKIELNPNAKWANGTPINAHTYVYSMKQLLNPEMINYRANNYVSGSSSIMGAYDYFWSGRDSYVTLDEYPTFKVDGKAAVLDVTPLMQAGFELDPKDVKGSGYDSYLLVGDKYLYDLYPDLYTNDCRMTLSLDTLNKFMEDFKKTQFYAVMKMEFPTAADAMAVVNKTTELTEDDLKALKDAIYILTAPLTNPELEYDDTVGLYALDDYTLVYVLQSTYSEFYFKMSMSSLWLVYEELYEKGKTKVGNLVTTNYGTSVDTYMSYGPYKLDTYEKGKQMRFVRNDNWYGYTDGNHKDQYMTDGITIDVVSQHSTALLGFEQGKYDDIGLDVNDMAKYGNSEWLKGVNTTYTWRLVFNTNLDVLKSLEGSSGNNKQVLANTAFRKAFSVAIDRQKFINEAVGAGTPAFYLINSLYMYDVENNPNSVYRNTEPAMKVVTDLFGIKYGEGEKYKTLEEAYKAVSGYDLDQARALMQQAYEECKANGTYKDGQKISLDLVVTSRTSISEAARKNATVLDAFLKEAIKGTGFEAGGIELNPKALSDYYNQLLGGACEMIFAAWGGAIYWPYSTISCYVNDANQSTKVHEGACWNPVTTSLTLTLDFNGDGVAEEKTMTYNQWGVALNQGEFANASFELRNEIMAALEYNVLNQYYTIPLYCDASVSLDSKRLKYIADEYNVMYGFGGLRFLKYTYSDQAWEKYVSKQGGTLSYE